MPLGAVAAAHPAAIADRSWQRVVALAPLARGLVVRWRQLMQLPFVRAGHPTSQSLLRVVLGRQHWPIAKKPLRGLQCTLSPRRMPHQRKLTRLSPAAAAGIMTRSVVLAVTTRRVLRVLPVGMAMPLRIRPLGKDTALRGTAVVVQTALTFFQLVAPTAQVLMLALQLATTMLPPEANGSFVGPRASRLARQPARPERRLLLQRAHVRSKSNTSNVMQMHNSRRRCPRNMAQWQHRAEARPLLPRRPGRRAALQLE
jgi:hypothetical protein